MCFVVVVLSCLISALLFGIASVAPGDEIVAYKENKSAAALQYPETRLVSSSPSYSSFFLYLFTFLSIPCVV